MKGLLILLLAFSLPAILLEAARLFICTRMGPKIHPAWAAGQLQFSPYFPKVGRQDDGLKEYGLPEVSIGYLFSLWPGAVGENQ